MKNPSDKHCPIPVGRQNYFPTQRVAVSPATITQKDRAYGAPFGPIPVSFRRLPACLTICKHPATAEELEAANIHRRQFLVENYDTPYMHDIVRAFRAIRDAKAY